MDLGAWHMWFKSRGGRELRKLVMDTWDPIGVRGVPEAADEYDGYLGTVAEKLRLGADVESIASILGGYRTESMGLPADHTGDQAAASAIVAWYAGAMRDGEGHGD